MEMVSCISSYIHPIGEWLFTLPLELLLRFKFKSKKLEALYTQEKGAERYDAAVIDAFFEVMQIIHSARDERDLRELKSLHFEKLSGKRQGQHSLRLNKQWRLIITLTQDERGRLVVIVEIADYH